MIYLHNLFHMFSRIIQTLQITMHATEFQDAFFGHRTQHKGGAVSIYIFDKFLVNPNLLH